MGTLYPSQPYQAEERLNSVEQAVQVAWIPITPLASWGKSGSAPAAAKDLAYRKTPEGKIQLRGYIDQGWSGGTGTAICQLPAEARPPVDTMFTVLTAGSPTLAQVTIYAATGYINWNGGGSTFIDLQTIEYFV